MSDNKKIAIALVSAIAVVLIALFSFLYLIGRGPNSNKNNPLNTAGVPTIRPTPVTAKTPDTTPKLYATPIASPTSTNYFDTADWQTYKNDEYGFELRFPGNWLINPKRLKTFYHLPFSTDFEKVGEIATLNVFSNKKDFVDTYGYLWKENLPTYNVKGVLIQELESKDDNSASMLYFFNNNGNYFVLVGSEWGDPTTEGAIEITHQILWTFRFLN